MLDGSETRPQTKMFLSVSTQTWTNALVNTCKMPF